MAIPLKYNLRNLVARKTSTGMTAFVIGLVVAVFLCVLALVQGVTRTLSVSASTRNVLAMRVGSQAEMQSVITRDQAEQMQALNRIDYIPRPAEVYEALSELVFGEKGQTRATGMLAKPRWRR